jgi:serine/threonine protein kinase
MDKYHVLEFIGEGSFAKVHRGRRKYSGQVKIIQLIKQNLLKIVKILIQFLDCCFKIHFKIEQK